MDENVQYQPRTETLCDNDILIELPQLINLSVLSEEQRSAVVIASRLVVAMREFAGLSYSYKRLLETANSDNWLRADVAVIEEQLVSTEQIVNSTKERLAIFRTNHAAIIEPLLRAGYAVKDAQLREQDRIRLAEWRKNRGQ